MIDRMNGNGMKEIQDVVSKVSDSSSNKAPRREIRAQPQAPRITVFEKTLRQFHNPFLANLGFYKSLNF
jgi:hypothetical protein